MRPMLATPGDRVPEGEAWSHEVKWDGMRLLADAIRGGGGGGVRLTSRNENDVTPAWPDVAAGAPVGRDLLVDGEVIAMGQRGVPDFRTLQARMHVRRAGSVRRLVEQVPVTFMAFDLLRLDGADLTGRPLHERRDLLAEALEGGPWQVPAAYDDGPMLHAATLQQGLEGIVSKRLSSRYVPGDRSRHWLKFAHRHRSTYVVGGWRPQEGTDDRLGSVLVGEVGPEGLLYRGRVGSGIGPRQAPVLKEALAGIGRATSPFDDEVPREDRQGTHWVEPLLVVDVDTHGHHLDRGHQRLRQPSFQGVRPDLTPEDLCD